MVKSVVDQSTGEIEGIEMGVKTPGFGASELEWIRDSMDMKIKSLERARTAAKSGSALQKALEEDIVIVRGIAARL